MVRPSTWMRSCARSALLPSSRTTLPLTLTWPAAISSSAFRRDATPAWARIFCSRSAPISLRLRRLGRWRWREHGGRRLRRFVRLLDGALQLLQRALALDRRLDHPLFRRRIAFQAGERRRRPRRFLLDDLARLFGELLELAQRGELGQVPEVEQLEELLRRAEDERPSRLVLLSQDADQLAFEKGLGHRAAIDAAQVLHLR